MKPVRVKICGITNREDAVCVVEAGADALGFIFYEKSPRFVTRETAAAIVAALPPFVTPVGVYVNAARETINEVTAACGLGAIQLHGDEQAGACAGHDRPVIRAVRMGGDFNAESLAPYRDAGVSAFLLDTARNGMYGGTGETFDWSLAGTVEPFGKLVLSGGLSPENVEDALRTVRPYAVDASSGVESEPGKKDHAKVKAFVATAKAFTQ